VVRYRVNAPQVISETVGGETIIVNLATGHYFSLQGTAVDIWQGVERGEAAESIVLELEQRYEAGDGEIGAAVQKLLDDFAAAELLVADANGAGTVATASSQDVGERVPFVAPSVSTFTDMQDIILLDPVHEVDTRGWPHASAGA
jgi:Coenzyme PQQ synthesis protein D (PqqD)